MDARHPVYLQFQGFLRTPPLWKTTAHFAYPQFEVKQQQLPIILEEALVLPERLVLGRRIEYFFQYYISHFSEKEILLANTPIFAGKITTGEIDFILKSPETRQVSHVELMYKFYLYDPEIPEELERWIGPNRQDTLCKKLGKLRTQQFPILYRKESLALLESLNCKAEEIAQEVCFKAKLFVPLSLSQHVFPFINNECIAGYWIRASEFSEEVYGDFSFYSPKKADWPVDPASWDEWYSFAEIVKQVEYLLSQEKSPLVWIRENESKYRRMFIVWW